MKLKSVTVTGLAGYSEVSWRGLRPTENLLVGRNGSGKSSLLEAITIGLNFVHGKRSGDLLTGASPETEIHFVFSDDRERTMTLGEIRTSKTPGGTSPVENVLYVHESRRAKSRIGKGRSSQTQHSSNRYEFVLSELQALRRGDAGERKLAEDVVTEALKLPHAGHASEWEWVVHVLSTGRPGSRRPASCGQYDVLSFLLDVLRTERAVEAAKLQPFVILDNPDAFLHPALQGELVEWMRRRLPDAQVLIATHSLKLLARAAPPTIFWLRREFAGPDQRVLVQPVRDLSPSGQNVFFELYGDDRSSAVLQLALGLESSEYLAFLCECALPCRSVTRPEPLEADAQIQAVIAELSRFEGPWTLVDVGAGAGDLLLGAERLGIANQALEYIAVEPTPSELLKGRIDAARKAGGVAPTSRSEPTMESIPSQCDAVVFMNSCHALDLDQLAELLSIALQRLRPSSDSRCVIHEVELLGGGERRFVMWSPEDYRAVFDAIHAIEVEERPFNRARGVPIHTTVLRRHVGQSLPNDLATQLRSGFEARLGPKLESLLEQLKSMEGEAERSPLSEALRQRRYAFVSQQCSTICRLLVDRKLLELPRPNPSSGAAPATGRGP